MTELASKIENTIFAEHFVSGPYERVFLQPGQEKQYIRNYIDFFDGRIEYLFRIEEYYNLLVVGLQSVLGDVSLVVIEPEHFAKLPDYIQHTQIMFVVDDIEAVYRKAEKNAIPILQQRTVNIMGAQGRLELAPGYIVELVETTNLELFHPDITVLDLPAQHSIVN